MTDPAYVHLVLVIDRSGSIRSVLSDMQGGYDTFIAGQAANPGRTTVSLFQFDTAHDTVCSFAGISDKAVTGYKIVPRGGTALLDAVGTAVTRTGEELAAMPESQRPGKVVVVIATDGAENSSREYTKTQIRDMTARQERDYRWTFVYIGANQDTFAEAGRIGVGWNTTLASAGTPAATAASWVNTLSMVSRGRSTGDYAYTQDERDASAE